MRLIISALLLQAACAASISPLANSIFSKFLPAGSADVAVPAVEAPAAPAKRVLAAGESGVTDFILVNSETGADIMLLTDGTMVDTKSLGKDLTVRIASVNSKCVQMDLNEGNMRRVECPEDSGTNDVYLAGVSETTGAAFSANSIAKARDHILTACPSDQATGSFTDDSQKNKAVSSSPGCLTVSFTTCAGSSCGGGFASVKLPSTDVESAPSSIYGSVSGDLSVWGTLTVAFAGPPASEMGITVPGVYREPYPCPDYRLDVTFTHKGSGSTFVVPGFYAGDGNSANDGTMSGNVWECKFVPDAAGDWEYTVKFVQGTNVAQNGGGNPGGFFNKATGEFVVAEAASDNASKGRLSAVDGEYFEFADGTSLLQVGPDSPQNLLAYADFDNTDGVKNYNDHKSDYNDGDPTFSNGKGKGLVGAINYLSSVGVNVLTVTTLSDDGTVHPYRLANNMWSFDNSKIAQWSVILEHAASKGMVLRIKLQDSGNGDVLDDGNLFEQRKIYYREMIARLGASPAVIWDLGDGLTTEQAKAYSDYIRKVDPYNSPITTRGADRALWEIANIDGVSLLGGSADTEIWVDSNNGNDNNGRRSLVVTSSSQSDQATAVLPDSEDPNHDATRQDMWSHFMAGGSGVHFYFGLSFAESDLTLQDFRSRDSLWGQSSHARSFFEALPIKTMASANSLISSAGSLGFANSDRSIIVVYKYAGSAAPAVNLTTGSYSVEWYNPREGGAMAVGSVKTVGAGSGVSLGRSPGADDADWAILLTRLAA